MHGMLADLALHTSCLLFWHRHSKCAWIFGCVVPSKWIIWLKSSYTSSGRWRFETQVLESTHEMLRVNWITNGVMCEASLKHAVYTTCGGKKSQSGRKLQAPSLSFSLTLSLLTPFCSLSVFIFLSFSPSLFIHVCVRIQRQVENHTSLNDCHLHRYTQQ